MAVERARLESKLDGWSRSTKLTMDAANDVTSELEDWKRQLRAEQVAEIEDAAALREKLNVCCQIMLL